MSSSKREQILSAIVLAVSGAAGVDGRVYRSDPEATVREDQPCINVNWTSETQSEIATWYVERSLNVSVSILTRGDTPDVLADPIATDLYSLVMADTSLGGLAIDIEPGDTAFEVLSADQSAGKLTQEFVVKYRHSYADMTA